jgi:hypothetical protein
MGWWMHHLVPLVNSTSPFLDSFSTLYNGRATIETDHYMKEPDVITETHDPKNNFTFRVIAYRKLTPAEMRKALFVWKHQGDKKRSLQNETVTVTSIIGYNEGQEKDTSF